MNTQSNEGFKWGIHQLVVVGGGLVAVQACVHFVIKFS